MTILAIEKAFTTLDQVEHQFGLHPNPDPDFFPEWCSDRPELTPLEHTTLDQIKARFLYSTAKGNVTENTVNMLVVSPLLHLAHFFDPPFHFRAEESVEIQVEDDRIYRGRIDGLVLKERIWVVLVESKHSRLKFTLGIPQTLAYMMANPYPDRPSFSLITDGDTFIFVKLSQQPQPWYSLSTLYSLYDRSANRLYDVLQVLKVIGKIATETNDS